MTSLFARMPGVVFAAILAVLSVSPTAGQQAPAAGQQLILSGDLVYFFGQGRPNNCVMANRYKRGEPVGFRMTAIDPMTGKRDRAAQLVVHITYGGKTVDVPMRDRQTEQQPERDFFVAKWVVPDDAPIGALSYTVTAKNAQGSTGTWKPFEHPLSALTIIE
jgi:hypothetical protein